MSLQFSYVTNPTHVFFGKGSASRAAEAADILGCKRLLVLATPQQKAMAEELACRLGDLCLGVYAKAKMHTPVKVTTAAMRVIEEQKVDGVVSLGGGSTIGLGKAIAYRTGLPQIAIPTTYAGSEVTPILGQTENNTKTTLRSSKVVPEVVIYDPTFTRSLPQAMSITSGINAIAHAVEALYAEDRNPVSSMMAAEGANALIDALPLIAKDGADDQAREKALYGCWLCGTVLGNVGMALHHKLCHTLGGLFNLPHAETHTVILPHATAYNYQSVPDQLAPLCAALDTDSPGEGLFKFARKLGAPTSLRELGMDEEGIDLATDQAMANPYWNPRRLDHREIRKLIENAYFGHRPGG
ncbi:MAG: maleylacetate reductase [Pseudomonadota bacterium]